MAGDTESYRFVTVLFHLQWRHWGLWEKRQRHFCETLVAVLLSPRLSIAIQRGNAASVVGTASSDGCLDDVFYL